MIGQASVLLGCGDGTFSGKITFTTQSGTYCYGYAVNLSDLNNDGILDLITAGHAESQGQAVVFLGNGDGTFRSKRTWATETGSSAGHSRAVTSGDVNGDGNMDLVTAGYSSSGTRRGQADVLLGNGDGTFKARLAFTTEVGSAGHAMSHAVELGDMNGDGILDLLTSGYANNAWNGGQASILFGNGNGTFGNRVTFATEIGTAGSKSNALSVGDLNGDGTLDVVTAGYNRFGAIQGQASVLLGNGNGTFRARISYATEIGSASGSSSAAALGDMNGDGILDLVTGGSQLSVGSYAQASVLLGNGDGTFGGKITYTTQFESGSNTYALALGDLNADGILDLAAAGNRYPGTPIAHAAILVGIAREGVAPILPFSLGTAADARQAMGMLDNKLKTLSAQRGTVGAFQSRLAVAHNTLQASRENSSAAAGRILDADVAEQSANLMRTQILQQAGAAVLAQANMQPSLALRLLV